MGPLQQCHYDDKDQDEETKYWRQQAAEPQETVTNYGQLPTDRRLPLLAELDLYLSTRVSIGKVKQN